MYSDRLLQLAIECAEFCHALQKDKNGSPYIEHPRRVMLNADTNAKRILSALHDCLEDQRVRLIEFIKAELNSDLEVDDSDEAALWLVGLLFGTEISEALDAISHRKNEPREEYYKRVLQNALAHAVKLLDIADNTDPDRLAQLDAATQTRLNTKYNAALAILAI